MEQELGSHSSRPTGIWASKGNRPWHLHEREIAKTLREKTSNESMSHSSSKCTLKDGQKHGWKPETMRPPVLITFAISSTLIILFLEYLAQRSQKAGGLSLVDDPKQLSPTITFAYLYLPMIIAAIYSLIWNWVDLDVKRIQPWLELSKTEGASGKCSLFLDYPVDFVGFVPFKAAKQRHWPVFYSGTIMVLILWVVTPLQSSVLGTRSVLLHQSTEMKAPSQLMDSKAQAAVLDQAVLNAAYAITWLQQPYPPFTAADYTLLPFFPSEPAKANVANWTGVTTKYWTDLQCWPATVSHPRPKLPQAVTFDNGRGCNTSEIDVDVAKSGYNLLYVGWWNSGWADFFLDGPSCGPVAANQFLAAWFQGVNYVKINVSALFCEVSYHKQQVRALVQADGLVPIDDQIEPLGDPEQLLVSEFNSSAFNYLLGAGASPMDIPREYPFTDLLDQWPNVQDRGLDRPLWSPMVGFALGTNNFTLDQYSDPEVLSSTFRAAHRRIFSAAFPTLLTNRTASSNAEGEIHIVKYGVVVSRFFSALVEGFLGLITVLVVLLMSRCIQCQSMLSDDPSSLGSLFGIIQHSSLLLKQLMGTGTSSAEKLQEKLEGCSFKLVCGCQDFSGLRTLRLIGGLNGDATWTLDSTRGRGGTESMDHYSPIKPLALRGLSGTFFSLVLCAALGVLFYLWREDKAIGGLSQPSSSFEVNILLTNYIPTIFATLIEPFWVILNRFLCLLQPFYDLLSDRGTAQRTVNAQYMALPPQLALWRAFKSGHILLGLLCITALLGNVLSVGLGAMFHDRPVDKIQPVVMVCQGKSTLSVDQLQQLSRKFPTINDKFYTVMANLSYETPLPPWMTTDFSFLPVSLSSKVSTEDTLYSATTIGFGVEPACGSLDYFITQNEPPRLNISVASPSGNVTTCVRDYQPTSLMFKSKYYKPPDGPGAAEVVNAFPTAYSNHSDCGQSLLLGWSRANISHVAGTMNSSFILCTPVPKIAEFHISFDHQGRVRSATPVRNSTSDHSFADLAAALRQFVYTLNRRIALDTQWHNDTLSQDWYSYLLKLQTGNDDLLNALTPTPDPESILPSVTELYKLIFATAFNGAQRSLTNGSGEAIIGSQTVTETRIFVSSPAFIVSVTILILYIFMTGVLYGWGVTFFLPRMPTTIGSQLAFIAPSSLANASSAPSHDFIIDDEMFRFGRLVGPDGRAQIGIDFADKVVPLDPASLIKGETRRKKITIFGAELRLGRGDGKAHEVLI